MFRNFRGDSPIEQRSGFALEAKEMQIVLSHGVPLPDTTEKNCSISANRVPHTARAFVCIDEFGKGTEDAHATALCAAVLRLLDQVCRLYLHCSGLAG
jgi:hypothetical protein